MFVSLSESCAKHVAKKQPQQSQLSQRDRATLDVYVTMIRIVCQTIIVVCR